MDNKLLLSAAGLLAATDLRTMSAGAYNPDVQAGVPEDMWNGGGLYTGFNAVAAQTVQLFSTLAADAAGGTGARTVLIFGLDANYAEISETVTLNGTTPVATTQAFVRVFSGRVTGVGSGGSNAGVITCRQSVANANVFFSIPVQHNITQVGARTIPAGHKGLLVRYKMGVSQSNATQNSYAECCLRIRPFGEAFALLAKNEVSNHKSVDVHLATGILLPEKADFALHCRTTTATVAVFGAMEVVLFKL